jgi:hypothetical protein
VISAFSCDILPWVLSSLGGVRRASDAKRRAPTPEVHARHRTYLPRVRGRYLIRRLAVPRTSLLWRRSAVDVRAIVRVLYRALLRELGAPETLDAYPSDSNQDPATGPTAAPGIAAEMELATIVLRERPQPCGCRSCALAQALFFACVHCAQAAGKEFHEDGSGEHAVYAMARDLWQLRRLSVGQIIGLAEQLKRYAAERRSLETQGAVCIPWHVELTQRIESAANALMESPSLSKNTIDGRPLSHALQAGFASPDLREPFGKKPRKALLTHLSALLSGGRFSHREIADHLPDGLGGTPAERIERVKKRLRSARN